MGSSIVLETLLGVREAAFEALADAADEVLLGVGRVVR